MKVVFMGTPEFAVPVLQTLIDKYDVVCVYTQPPRPAGRGHKMTPSPVQQLAEKFKSKNKTIICRDLLGLDVEQDSPVPEDRTQEYYLKRPCKHLVGDAAEIIAEYIKQNS